MSWPHIRNYKILAIYGVNVENFQCLNTLKHILSYKQNILPNKPYSSLIKGTQNKISSSSEVHSSKLHVCTTIPKIGPKKLQILSSYPTFSSIDLNFNNAATLNYLKYIYKHTYITRKRLNSTKVVSLVYLETLKSTCFHNITS